MKLLIVDDEAPARNRLRTLLNEIDGNIIIFEAKNGVEALHLAQQQPFNIVLLDIRMPGMDGLETAQHFNQLPQPPAIIFSTAYDAYALKAFDCHAIDYLLKPMRIERLKIALNKAKVLLPPQLAALNPLIIKHQHISIIEHGRVLLIPIEEVVYFRAELKYITVRTRTGAYLLEDTLTHLETTFSHLFMRCHRNCIVAKKFIKGYEKRLLKPHEEVEDCEADLLIDSEKHTAVLSDKKAEKKWVILLNQLEEVIPVSRRHQHNLREIRSH